MLALASVLLFSACEKESTKEDDKKPPVEEDKGYSEGVLIANEGSFGAGNGSISYFDNDKKDVTNKIFNTVNNLPLGDVVQSVYRGKTNTYICVNVSNKVEVVNSKTFESIATIENLPQPRYAVEKDGKLYVSCWGNGGQVKIIDVASNTVTDSLMVGSGPEAVSVVNNNLYVANSGGYALDSTISIVDLSNNNVTSIDLGAYNPSSMAVDADNKLCVLAKGSVIYDASWNIIGHNPSKLISINTTDNTISKTVDLFSDKHPAHLAISNNNESIYYGGGYGFDGIFKIDYNATTAPSTALITGMYYGFLVNSVSNNIFALEAAAASNGKLIRYSNDGTKIDEFEIGIFPNGGASKRIGRN